MHSLVVCWSSQVSSTLGATSKAKDFIVTEPLHSALVMCTKSAATAPSARLVSSDGQSGNSQELSAGMIKLAHQILDLANSLH
jgi:hypothetical protein